MHVGVYICVQILEHGGDCACMCTVASSVFFFFSFLLLYEGCYICCPCRRVCVSCLCPRCLCVSDSSAGFTASPSILSSQLYQSVLCPNPFLLSHFPPLSTVFLSFSRFLFSLLFRSIPFSAGSYAKKINAENYRSMENACASFPPFL